MWCVRCQKDLAYCTCPDLEERLDSCPNFAYRKCVKCGKHYARCKCSEPEWVMSNGEGRFVPIAEPSKEIH